MRKAGTLKMELARESRGFLPVLWMDKLAQRGHVHSVPSVLLWPRLARENSLAWAASQHPTVLCLSHPLPSPVFSPTLHRNDPRRHRSGIQEILATDGSPCREGQQWLGKARAWHWGQGGHHRSCPVPFTVTWDPVSYTLPCIFGVHILLLALLSVSTSCLHCMLLP